MRIILATLACLAAAAAYAADPPAAGKAQASASADRQAAPAARERGTMDRLDLDTTSITGNRELPKVMYVVPWKRADLGDLSGKPANSLLDEALAPVDRTVFRREVKYFGAVDAASSAQAETPVTAPAGQP